MARFWHHAHVKQHNDTWIADLPLLDTDRPLWVYANVRYPLAQPVTGAGYYYGVYTAKDVNLSSRMAVATSAELNASGVKATDKPSPVIEAFEADWQKEWFTYDLTGNWPLKTHKLYDPKWQPLSSGKLALEVRSAQANKLVIGLDNHAAEIQLTGGTEWQRVMLAPSDFKNASGESLPSWKGIKELRLGDKETLRAKDGKTLVLGAAWKGTEPKFRKLEWSVVD
jgi:hypothetical protein